MTLFWLIVCPWIPFIIWFLEIGILIYISFQNMQAGVQNIFVPQLVFYLFSKIRMWALPWTRTILKDKNKYLEITSDQQESNKELVH